MRTKNSLSLLAGVALAAIVTGSLGADYRPASRMAWAFDGNVDESERVGNILYLAGDFNAAAPIGNLAPRLVELQTSGSAAPTRPLPAPAGSVDVIVPDGAGGYFVGGRFPSIGAVAQATLAHVRPDGTVDPAFVPVFVPVGSLPEASVRALALAGNTLYVGGHFSEVSGSARVNAVALDAATGSVLPWNPGGTLGLRSAGTRAPGRQRRRTAAPRGAAR